ncbi:hypothetical protein Tco_1196303 [Tanacetum coccineum]
MVAYLQKSEGSEGFHQIIDFLNASHIQYALTENPTIYVSFIKQFWRTATARTSANGEVELTATIDGQVKTITEASLRRHLKLEDNGGVTTCHTPRRGLDGIRVRGRDFIILQTQGTRERPLIDVLKIITCCII